MQAYQDAPAQVSYQLATVDEVRERIQEAVGAHYQTIMNELKAADYASIGSVTKEVFREILNKHALRLNDEQVGWFCWI